MKKIYFGGQFRFLYKDASKEVIKEDFRSKVLGDYQLMLRRPQCGYVQLSPNAQYVGPFYFYEEGTSAWDIVLNEFSMVERCTDAVFILDNESCPGSISELIHASFLKKNVNIFYVSTPIDEGEPENEINSKQWYAIQMASIVNPGNTDITECLTYEEAVKYVGEKVDMVVPSMGFEAEGHASTVIGFKEGEVVVYRQGEIIVY
jgi:hypothetical protein